MRGHLARWIVSVGLVVLLVAQASTSFAIDAPGVLGDFDVSNGHYYEQANLHAGHGFLVSEDDSVPLWSEFQRLGGTEALGYPISRRYQCDGAVCQVFQRAVFKWLPGARAVELLSVFDMLHGSGQDAWLHEQWGVPPWKAPEVPAQTTSKQNTVQTQQPDQRAMIEANPAIQATYDQLGPLSQAVYGSARAYQFADGTSTLRTQRAVFVRSANAETPVQVVPAGRVFAAAGLVPAEAMEPVTAPVALDSTPPIRIRIPDLGINATVISMDMGDDDILPVPSTGEEVVWYSYGARLGEEGNAVLAGHIDWNRKPGVFWSLRDAQPGQTITIVSSASRAYEYRVDWARSFVEDSPEGLQALRSRVGGTTITLVTCTGRFDLGSRSYLDRHIVRATLVARRGFQPAT